MIRFVIFFILPSVPVFVSSQHDPVVDTPLGEILGTYEFSRRGIEFFSFRGIPYAEPPVGKLRFKPPVPVKQFDHIFDAMEDGPACHQPFREDESEDCLRLNVYTRRINEPENLRPVLVFIHGGGYVINTAQSSYLGPEYLMDHDIVLVTFNYRLGTLGFLSTGDKYSPGNYGMKDQVEVLRWVQRNIRYFGGDRTRITIAGGSSGASSVGLHMLSPMSRGLFHAAITASGSAANSWAIDRNPLETARKVAAALNCPTRNSKDLMECIRRISARNVGNVYQDFKEWHDYPPIILKPVVEDGNSWGDRFLTKDPIESLREGDVADVPLFVGTTRDEFLFAAIPIVRNKEWSDDLSTNWYDLAPVVFSYDHNDTVSDELRLHYLGGVDEPIRESSLEGLGALFSDSLMIPATVQSARVISNINTEPVYLYQFNYLGNYGPYWPGTRKPIGVLHTSDLIYLFYDSTSYPFINTTGKDGPVVDRLTTLWANFVKTGNPTPRPSKILDNVIWSPYQTNYPSYMDINRNLKMKEGLYYEDRIYFWDYLFPIEDASFNKQTKP